MIRRTAERPALDLFDDLQAIARLETSLNATERRKAPTVRDFSRLERYIPGLRG